ncbi:hypothetical protein [Streptomyces sp. NPDC046727]|uniref:hypothetical protein n=1 Tax=Streptomyces sp. NPDC046727 TaxID=3155373 RepID=UPI0033DC9B0C
MRPDSPAYLRVVRTSGWYDLIVTAGFATPWTYRLVHHLRPLRSHGVLDGAARVLFSLWLAYALAHGGPAVLWPFLVVGVSFGVAQLAPWPRARATAGRESVRHS